MLAFLCSVMSVRDSPVHNLVHQNEQIFLRVMTRILDKTLIHCQVSFKAL